MKGYNQHKVKKNKKLKSSLELFEKGIDHQVRDLILGEYFYNVCRRYTNLLYFIYMEANKVLKLRRKAIGCESDDDVPLPSSVFLTHKASLRIFFEQQRINYHLSNLLTGTNIEKPIGEIFVATSKIEASPDVEIKKSGKDREVSPRSTNGMRTKRSSKRYIK